MNIGTTASRRRYASVLSLTLHFGEQNDRAYMAVDKRA